MGFGIKELIIILVIVIVLFGTKKLKNIGSDLGGAIKGFRKAMDDDSAGKIEKEEQSSVEANQADTKDKTSAGPEKSDG